MSTGRTSGTFQPSFPAMDESSTATSSGRVALAETSLDLQSDLERATHLIGNAASVKNTGIMSLVLSGLPQPMYQSRANSSSFQRRPHIWCLCPTGLSAC
jgi:hypothetical protein